MLIILENYCFGVAILTLLISQILSRHELLCVCVFYFFILKSQILIANILKNQDYMSFEKKLRCSAILT